MEPNDGLAQSKKAHHVARPTKRKPRNVTWMEPVIESVDGEMAQQRVPDHSNDTCHMESSKPLEMMGRALKIGKRHLRRRRRLATVASWVVMFCLIFLLLLRALYWHDVHKRGASKPTPRASFLGHTSSESFWELSNEDVLQDEGRRDQPVNVSVDIEEKTFS